MKRCFIFLLIFAILFSILIVQAKENISMGAGGGGLCIQYDICKDGTEVNYCIPVTTTKEGEKNYCKCDIDTASLCHTTKASYEFYGKIGGDNEGSSNYRFKYPVDVVVDSKNNIYVADDENDRVIMYDSKLNFTGFLAYSLTNPLLITIDSSDYIYLVDGKRVRKLDTNGKVIFQIKGIIMNSSTWTSKGGDFIPADELYFYPQGIAVNSKGEILLTGEGRIFLFDSSGGFKKAFDRNLENPSKIAVDSKDNIYVVDVLDRTTNFIFKYTPDFEFAGEIDRTFQITRDIEFDNDDSIYLTDSSNQRIEVYDKNFSYYATIGGHRAGNENNQLSYPRGIYVGRDKRVYVTNFGNHRLQIFTQVIKAPLPSEKASNESLNTNVSNKNPKIHQGTNQGFTGRIINWFKRLFGKG